MKQSDNPLETFRQALTGAGVECDLAWSPVFRPGGLDVLGGREAVLHDDGVVAAEQEGGEAEEPEAPTGDRVYGSARGERPGL